VINYKKIYWWATR